MLIKPSDKSDPRELLRIIKKATSAQEILEAGEALKRILKKKSP